ncbi:MAG: cation diffusion facilitator family transporter [Acidobacteriota bacterium]|nr:cation diffusion facilitator family transporter [Acidobacteriota bacterium]
MHSHHHAQGTGKVLLWSLLATTLFVAVEVVAGIRANSLSLLSDAGHNATDALAILLAWFGFYVQSKPADESRTFGYQRAGVLAAFINALTLVLLSGWIFYEGYQRILRPEPVRETLMILVAGLGLVLNGGIMWGLRMARHNDLNVRSAFVHMLGDLLGSAAILAGGFAIHFTRWNRVDAILSVVIAALVVWTAWDIIRESLNILLEGLPRGLELRSVIADMRKVEGVLDVHDLHIWSIGSSSHACSCHVLIEDVPPSASDSILQRLNHVLADHYRIRHTTVQFEHVNCVVSEKGCVIPVEAGHAHQGHQH